MYVVGTAGHVDHGKSTLVKTLTGIDPDRWEEEQRREMTIDLGFAWLTLPGGQTVSLVDVPGHERFIKNMLAGVGGIDAALLVVAADEAVMPQTEEHLAILDLLEISRGVVALTKADLVEEEWLALVGEDVRARLAGTALEGAPIVPVSARSGCGLAELVQELERVLEATPSRSEARGAARLPIDRSFTIGGFGTVVTGTLLDGPLAVGDEVEIVPQRLRARVRGLQTHQQRGERALAGSRVAVNLAGVSHHAVGRGDVLALPGRLEPTELLDAQLRLTSDARPVQQNERLDLFVGACEVACRVTLLDADTIAAGGSGWVQLRLERPIAAARGDRYILRQLSPSRTLGGGRIVDTRPARHRRFRPEVLSGLAALARGTPADLLRQALADRQPRTWADLLRSTGLVADTAAGGVAELEAQEALIILSGQRSAGPAANEQALAPHSWLISAEGWQALSQKIAAAVSGYHRRYALRAGMPREELRSRLKLSTEALDAAVGLAIAEGLLLAQEASVRAPTHQPLPDARQQREIHALVEAHRRAPYSPPAPEIEPELLAYLIEQGQLVRIAPDITFLPTAYQEMVTWVQSEIASAGSITVAQFRDRFATSRKYALALLEHLDERKITRRAGDARVLY